MILIGHGFEKFPTGQLLASSIERNWSGILAERRSHPAGDLPAYIPTSTEVAILMRTKSPSVVTRRGAGYLQQTRATSGTVWLCPAGLGEDFIEISDDIADVLHVYLPPNPFSALVREHSSRDFSTASLRYEAGFHDQLLMQIGQAIATEMEIETSTGRLLIESLALGLMARLLSRYSDIALEVPVPSTAPKGLDRRRLRRVFEFIETHLEDDITIKDLASVAYLSRFHFSRAFKAAVGKSPRRHVSERRLALAKSLLAQGKRSLTEIAFACRFSSQANFSRSFRRATDMTPGQYRVTSRR